HTGRHVKTIREFLEQSHVPMILPRRHTESLATATQPDGDTAWPWTTAPRSGYSPSCTAAGTAPWLPHARWLSPRRRPDGASGCQTPRRRRHATPAPAPCPRTSGTPPIGGAGKSQRSQHPAQPQRCDHAHRPPRGGDRDDSTLASRRPGMGRSHGRVDPRLIHKNQPFWLDSPHLPLVSPSFLLHVRPLPLAGVQRLLLVGQTKPTQGAPDSRQGAGEASLLLQLVQRGVGLLFDQLAQSLLVAWTQCGIRPTAVRLGSQGAGVATALQQPDNERKTDAEPSNDLTLGAFPMINCRRDSLAEVIRAGCHGSLLLFSCPSVGLRFPLHALSPSGGDPGLLNGGRKSVQSREICRRGRFPARPCMVGGCASHSIVPGHHLLE